MKDTEPTVHFEPAKAGLLHCVVPAGTIVTVGGHRVTLTVDHPAVLDQTAAVAMLPALQ